MIGKVRAARSPVPKGPRHPHTAGFGLVLAAAFALFSAGTATAESVPAQITADSLFSEEGYRMRQYRAPTPDSLSSATTVSGPQLQLMLSVHPNPVLVDVIKVPWRQGRFVETEPHQNIPGSIWLPAAGLGELPEAWEEHVREVLHQATGGNLSQGLVFYCKADCWLSWNAARRAARFGYQRVYWFRDGVDGWRELGLKFADADPIAPTGKMMELQ